MFKFDDEKSGFVFDEEPAKIVFDDEQPAGSDPSFTRIAGGVGAEVTIGVGSQAAGAALAPFTLGISYPVLAFAGGVGGSITAQKAFEGREKISVGRALFAGLLNLIPASSAARGGVKVGAAGAKTLGTVAAKEAGRGFAIGTGEATAIAAIDEGRAPTFNELAMYGGAGALFGGTIGIAVKGGEKLYAKIKNRTPEQIDAMVKSGELTAADLTPLGDNPEVNTAIRSLQEAVEQAQSPSPAARAVAETPTSAWFAPGTIPSLKVLASSGFPSVAVGRETRDVALSWKSQVDSAAETGARIGAQVDRIVSRQADPEAAKRAANAFLDGGTDHLPDSLQPIRVDMELGRGKIKELQAAAVRNIDDGISSADPAMKEIIQQSMDEGRYVTREFRFFTDTHYRPTKAAYNAAVDELQQQNLIQAAARGEDMTPEAARARALKYLQELDAKKLSEVRHPNRYPSSADGILKEKKDLGPALLDYLGEITEPGERIRGTMTRLARHVYRDQTDAELKRVMLKNGLASQEFSEGATELYLKRNEQGGSGLYVQPHVQEAINQLYVGGEVGATGNRLMGLFKDAWFSASGMSKAVKVLGNPPSYAVNFLGNISLVAGMGINPGRGGLKGLRLALSEFGPIERLHRSPQARKALVDDMQEMTRYGIKEGNVIESDIRTTLERGLFSDLAQKALRPVSKAYVATDTMLRYVTWKAHQVAFRKIFPGAGEDRIKQFAADTTHDVYQNYGRINKPARELSQLGFFEQFASFTMEFTRNQINQLRVIKQMLQGTFGEGRGMGQANIRAMRAEGAKRLAAMSAVYASAYGGIKAWNAMGGVDDEKARAAKESFLPEYDENKLLAMQLTPDGKHIKWMNPSYVMPHAIPLSVMDKVLQGEPAEAVLGTIQDELIGEGSFLARSLFSAVTNRDLKTGKQISNQTDAGERFKELTGFALSDAFSPGIGREIDRWGMASRGQGALTNMDVALRQVGYRVNTAEIDLSARFRIKESIDNARGATGEYRAKRDHPRTSPQELERIYQTQNQSRKDAMAKIARHVQNLRTYNRSQEEIIQIMKDGLVGSKDILDILDGRITDLPRVDRQTPTDIWNERVGILPERDRIKEIHRIAREDPQLGRSLRDKHVRELQAGRRGVDRYDTLVMSLGVQDGERAAFIFRKMQETEDGAGFLNQMSHKGIAPPQVRAQIDTLQRAKAASAR